MTGLGQTVSKLYTGDGLACYVLVKGGSPV